MQAVRKLHGHLKAVKEAAVERSLPQAKPISLTPHEQTLDEDLEEAAQVGGSPFTLAFPCQVLTLALPAPLCCAPVTGSSL